MHERAVSCVLPLAAVAVARNHRIATAGLRAAHKPRPVRCHALTARAAIALLGVAAAGCEVPTAPAGGASLSPPAIYSEWWQEVEQCSGVTGDVGRISWYVVPCQEGETGFKCDVTPDGLCAGEWRAPHLIELAGPNRIFPDGYADDEWTVKHEMLHDLLGRPDHPQAFTDCHLALR